MCSQKVLYLVARASAYRCCAQALLRTMFAGDLWVRTGDLMRQDQQGFVFFVDRVGDTFRYACTTTELIYSSALVILA